MAEGDLHTATITRATRADSTIFATLAVAFRTKSVPRESEFSGLALVEVLQRHLDSVNKVFGLAIALRTAPAPAEEASTPEELAEEILEYECGWSQGGERRGI